MIHKINMITMIQNLRIKIILYYYFKIIDSNFKRLNKFIRFLSLNYWKINYTLDIDRLLNLI
jgi:hypothetical protein